MPDALAAAISATVLDAFSMAECFWLSALGLSCAVVVVSGSMSRAVVSLCAGLLLSAVGLSAVHARPRFTFGNPDLLAGIGFIPAMIGLFGLAEVLRNVMALPGAAETQLADGSAATVTTAAAS